MERTVRTAEHGLQQLGDCKGSQCSVPGSLRSVSNPKDGCAVQELSSPCGLATTRCCFSATARPSNLVVSSVNAVLVVLRVLAKLRLLAPSLRVLVPSLGVPIVLTLQAPTLPTSLLIPLLRASNAALSCCRSANDILRSLLSCVAEDATGVNDPRWQARELACADRGFLPLPMSPIQEGALAGSRLPTNVTCERDVPSASRQGNKWLNRT